MALLLDSSTSLQTRKNVFMIILAAALLVLAARLVQLQIVEGGSYRLQADAQGIKRMTIQPVRGAFYDRNGYVVVGSDGSHTLYVTPNQFDERSRMLLSEIVGLETTELDSLIDRYKTNAYTPARILRDINDTTWAKLNEYYYELGGVELENESKRFYSEDVRASHVLGYVKEINREDMDRSTFYQLGDMIGKTGIETEFESFVRGEKGFEFVAVNNRGQRIESFNDGMSDQSPLNGDDLFLGLDAELQAYGEHLMRINDYTGAIVAIEPETGEILAMVSAPDYDLEIFNGRTDPEEFRKIQSDERNPQYNRATKTAYPPGSTWKPLMVIAAMEEGLITPTTTFSCPGSFFYGGRSWGCHGGHGAVAAQRAIQASCNVYFYKLGLKMGIDIYHKWGTKLGFGRRLGVDVPENPGLLPSREYYDKVLGAGKWYAGVMVNLGIGQGELGVNPLQLAAYTAAIANDGVWIQPHFVSKIRNKKLGTIEEVAYEFNDLKLKPETIEVVQAGMYDVVNKPGGTAGHVKIPGIDVSGKTGTAQNSHGRDHSWFISYAPSDDPQIAMCVLVENSGFGGTYAAPLSKKLIDFYFNRVPTDGFVRFQDREKKPVRADISEDSELAGG